MFTIKSLILFYLVFLASTHSALAVSFSPTFSLSIAVPTRSKSEAEERRHEIEKTYLPQLRLKLRKICHDFFGDLATVSNLGTLSSDIIRPELDQWKVKVKSSGFCQIKERDSDTYIILVVKAFWMLHGLTKAEIAMKYSYDTPWALAKSIRSLRPNAAASKALIKLFQTWSPNPSEPFMHFSLLIEPILATGRDDQAFLEFVASCAIYSANCIDDVGVQDRAITHLTQSKLKIDRIIPILLKTWEREVARDHRNQENLDRLVFMIGSYRYAAKEAVDAYFAVSSTHESKFPISFKSLDGILPTKNNAFFWEEDSRRAWITVDDGFNLNYDTAICCGMSGRWSFGRSRGEFVIVSSLSTPLAISDDTLLLDFDENTMRLLRLIGAYDHSFMVLELKPQMDDFFGWD